MSESISKTLDYAVVTPPTNQEVAAKLNAYAVATPPTNQARFPKALLYVVVRSAPKPGASIQCIT